MNKKISISLAITIAIIAMTVTFSVTMVLAGQRFNNTVSSVKEKENMYSKLAEIDKYVRDNAYYEINDDTLNDTIASGYMLGTGDRAAVYYTANAYAELQDIADGKLMGIGVEIVKDAVHDAITNAKINKITNARFLKGDCTEYMLSTKDHFDVIIMDPPRRGSTKEFISAVKEIKPRTVIYVSCDPVTLARDLNLFKDTYDIVKVQPVDMFPNTLHVETVVLLSRKNN